VPRAWGAGGCQEEGGWPLIWRRQLPRPVRIKHEACRHREKKPMQKRHLRRTFARGGKTIRTFSTESTCVAIVLLETGGHGPGQPSPEPTPRTLAAGRARSAPRGEATPSRPASSSRPCTWTRSPPGPRRPRSWRAGSCGRPRGTAASVSCAARPGTSTAPRGASR
jgi:hypothetical protein